MIFLYNYFSLTLTMISVVNEINSQFYIAIEQTLFPVIKTISNALQTEVYDIQILVYKLN